MDTLKPDIRQISKRFPFCEHHKKAYLTWRIFAIYRMKKLLRNVLIAAAVLSVLSLPSVAQQVKRTPFDVTNYQMDVTLVPTERKINATVDVTFTPLEDTRSITFQLNGSLKVDSVTRLGAGTAVVPTGRATATQRRRLRD